MGRLFWHVAVAIAMLLLAGAPAGGPGAAAAARTAAPAGAAAADDLARLAQVRAKTARDVAREKAEQEKAQKRAVRRRPTRTAAVKRPSIQAPPPMRKPEAIADGPGISLAASLISGGEPLTQGVVWTIEPMTGDPTPIVTNDALPTLPLAAGHYRITAKLDDFLQSAEVDIPDEGIARLDLAFNAARLRVKVLPAEDAMPLEDAHIRILKIGVDGAPPVIDTRSAAFDDVLPAGIYRVEAAHGLARATEDIGLTAGADRTVELNLSVGYVRVRARPAPGEEPLTTAAFEIFAADGLEAQPTPMASMSGGDAVFILPAGAYRVVGRYGEASARQLVDIAPNTFTDVMMDLDAGRAVVTLTGAPEVTANAAFRLVRHDGDDGPGLVLSRSGRRLDVGLPAGAYSVEAEIEDGRRAEQEFIVEPGANVAVVLELPAAPPARLKLEAVAAGGGALPASDVTFSASPAAGDDRTPLAGLRAGEAVALAPGPWDIVAVHGPTGAETRLSLALDAGAETTERVEIPLGTATLALAEGTPAEGAEWVVTGMDGKEVAQREGTGASLLLAPGEYVVTLTAGGTAHTAALSVTAGHVTPVTLPTE